jgi:L-seryl-tRNA(Ser) seleniumtransferase
MTTHHSLYSQIPATDRLLREPRIHRCSEFGHTATVDVTPASGRSPMPIQAENALPDWCGVGAGSVERLERKRKARYAH